MRLQIAVLAILMFWKDPKMWILLKKLKKNQYKRLTFKGLQVALLFSDDFSLWEETHIC